MSAFKETGSTIFPIEPMETCLIRDITQSFTPKGMLQAIFDDEADEAFVVF